MGQSENSRNDPVKPKSRKGQIEAVKMNLIRFAWIKDTKKKKKGIVDNNLTWEKV